MATSRPRQTEVEAPSPQLTPSAPAMGGSDYNVFIWQQLSDIQRSVAEMNTNLLHLKSSVDSTKGKVEALIDWKHKIIGGAVVLGVVGTLLGFAISKAGDYITFKSPQPTPAALQQPAAPPPGK